MHWHAFPIIKRRNKLYYRYVWTLFGIPIWWWDKFDHTEEK